MLFRSRGAADGSDQISWSRPELKGEAWREGAAAYGDLGVAGGLFEPGHSLWIQSLNMIAMTWSLS